MEEQELENRIRLGEDSQTEFKREEVATDALEVAMVAFANAQGGKLIIGVSDDGRVTGVAASDKLLQRIDNIALNSIRPSLLVTAAKSRVQGKVVVVVDVPRGPQRPHSTHDGRYFIRTASGHAHATRQGLLELFISSGSVRPEEMSVTEAEISDLDDDYFMRFLRKANPTVAAEIAEGRLDRNRVLQNMKFAKETHPTIAGLNCLGREPARCVPYFMTSALRFKGTGVSGEILSRKDFGGKIEVQVLQAAEFVQACLPSPSRVEGFRSELPSSVPETAIREALVNAVAHRNYLSSSQVRVLVFDDRLEIVSPGRLVNTVTIESMRYGVHVPPNPVILSFLQRIGLATNSGTGVPRMWQVMKENGLPEPEFQQVGPDLKVILRLVASKS